MHKSLFVLLILCGCAAAADFDEDIRAPLTEEAKAYSAMLTGKMDRGEMSPEEARYLYTQKVNELTERAMAAQRARYPARAPQQTTNCRPDGYGGMRCTTR
jgi:hypothetical protein